MDINQIIFIGVICFLLYVFILNPFISQTKRARFTRYFRRAKNTRFSLIKKYSNETENIPDDITVEEMVGILALLSTRENISEAYAIALKLSSSRLKEKFNEEFFTYLFATGKRFSNIRWFKESIEMLNLGQMLAKQMDKEHWLFEFKDAIEYVNRLQTTGHPRA